MNSWIILLNSGQLNHEVLIWMERLSVLRKQTKQSSIVLFTIDLKNKKLDLKKLLSEWEYFYNHLRPYSALGGITPWEKYLELESKIPIQPEVTDWYFKNSHRLIPRSSTY